MKGLFKGLRCMFESEKEPEIQIGMPTDVKHVAHIGCDGPSTPAPSWMNEYQAEPSPGSPNVNVGSKDALPAGAPSVSPNRPPKTKQSRRQAASDSPGNPKPRRNKNSGNDSPPNESRTRKIKNSILGSESPSQEQSMKKTRKKKGSTSDGARSSRSKNKDPSTADTASVDSDCSDGMCIKPVD